MSGARQRAVPATYRNPVLDEDFPDPVILREPVDGAWWAYATQHTTPARWAHVQVARSPNLVDWELVGDALPERPAWSTSQWECAWAPDVVAAGGRFVMYYAAMRDSRAGMCIGTAVADHPAGPFRDTGAPLVCGDGYVAIDAMRFDDPATGRIWLYWGSDRRPIHVRELDASGLAFAAGSEAVTVLDPDPGRAYEELVEGPYVVLRDGWYVLFYSGDTFGGEDPHYAVLAARARSPLGPFERLGDAGEAGRGDSTIIARSERFTAPGHNSVFTDPCGADWLVYHAIDRRNPWNPGERAVRRPMLVDRIEWARGWPWIADGIPSDRPLAAPAAMVGS